MTAGLHRLARVPRIWLLWLGLLLLASHSLATWHPYSHSAAELASQADGKHYADLSACGLCLAGSANLGGAPPMAPAMLPPRLAPNAPQPTRLAWAQSAPARQPYAIRAPPTIAS
jgi:hypothetical protein